mgnify:FL=1
MLPKTVQPDAYRPLLMLLKEQGPFPLWKAGRLVGTLAVRPGPKGFPAGPEQLLISSSGTDAHLLSPRGQGDYLPPETRLSPERPTDGPEEVYRLCALLFHLLSGETLPVEGMRARRAAVRAGLSPLGLEPEAGEALLRLLDRGLRLEPARRFSSAAAFAAALGEVRARLDRTAAERLCLQGTAGHFQGEHLPLQPPVQLGRQPGACQILFPPSTPGVSRVHCRVELSWGTGLVTDLNSRFGTFLNGVRLEPFVPAEWPAGSVLSLGSAAQAFRLIHV